MWSGRSICTLPDRLFWYSKSRLTRILNMADLALHMAHKDHSYLHRFTHTHTNICTALQTATCTPCIDPAGLSLSLWAQILLNHGLIPCCTPCLLSATPPSLSPLPLFLLLLLHLTLPFSLCAIPSVSISAPSSLLSTPSCLQDNSIINWPS